MREKVLLLASDLNSPRGVKKLYWAARDASYSVCR